MTAVLDGKVLVLNSSWIPVNVTTVFDAVCMVFQERALAVDPETYATHTFENWVQTWEDAIRYAKIEDEKLIRSPSMIFPAPEVVLCRDYVGMGTGKLHRRPKFSRRNVYLRDHDTCQYCGKRKLPEELNLDHVIPKAKGGRMDWHNIVLSCIACNDKKRNRTPEEAGMKLIRPPKIPEATALRHSVSGMDRLRRKLDRMRQRIGRDVPKTWEQFLGKLYWDVELQE